jgi:hypothetical protein
VTGHLRRASNANTIELALQEMNVVIKYLQDNKITEGYTSILYRTPSEDVGFWFNNLSQSTDELNKAVNCTQLEKSNVLMKLRETLTDNKGDGTTVTRPDGISVYPNNVAFCLFGWIFTILLTIVSVFIAHEDL